ncbi:MAG: hypothetical protein AAB483_01670 [Patescibacteria group bacterium]
MSDHKHEASHDTPAAPAGGDHGHAKKHEGHTSEAIEHFMEALDKPVRDVFMTTEMTTGVETMANTPWMVATGILSGLFGFKFDTSHGTGHSSPALAHS